MRGIGLNGTIPTELENLSALTYLNLVANNLEGSIPTVLADLALSTLYLSGNNLCFNVDYALWATNTDSSGNTACANCVNPCENAGVCGKGEFTFTCNCTEWYNGTTCENNFNPCNSDPCFNGGDCTGINADEFECDCTADYDGDLCEDDINMCRSNPCPSGEICVNEPNDYTCEEAPPSSSGADGLASPPTWALKLMAAAVLMFSAFFFF